MDLEEIPTRELLTEIARRCDAPSRETLLASWAEPALRTVAEAEGITVAEILTVRSRTHAAAMPRQLVMALLRATTRRSFAEIGQVFGQDYGTAMHAVNKIANRVATSRSFRETWQTMVDAAAPSPPRRTSRQVSAAPNAAPA